MNQAMTLARDHKWLPVLNVVIIAVCAGLLYREHRHDVRGAGGPALGRVIFQIGRTQNKAASQVIFQDLQRNHAVRAGDTVRTARAAEVMLQLSDGARVELGEFSMVVINRPEKKLRLRYSYGILHVRKSKGRELDIVTKSGSVLVGRGDVSISRDDAGRTRVTVNSGSARVRAGGDEKSVTAGNKAVLNSSGPSIAPLVLERHAPADGRRIMGRGADFPVDFSWRFARPTTAKNAAVRFEVSSRADFKGIVIKKAPRGDKLRLRLSPGQYYWRVVRGSEVSESRRLFIARIPEVEPVYPISGSVFEYLLKPPAINFSWRRHAFAAGYRLEVARDPSFREPLHSLETTSRTRLLDLKAGVYYWRLRTVGMIPDASITGPAIRFTIRKTALPIQAPAAGARVNTNEVRREGLTFRWKAPVAGGNYELKIARDADFRDIIVKRSTAGTELNVKRELRPGKYFWRLRLTRGGANVSGATREFLVSLPLEAPAAVFPKPGSAVDMSSRDFLPLRWRPVPDVKRYRLVVRRVAGNKLVFSRTVTGTGYRFRDLLKLDTGKFTWSIASIGKDNRPGKARVTPFTITLQSTPGAPTIKDLRSGN